MVSQACTGPTSQVPRRKKEPSCHQSLKKTLPRGQTSQSQNSLCVRERCGGLKKVARAPAPSPLSSRRGPCRARQRSSKKLAFSTMTITSRTKTAASMPRPQERCTPTTSLGCHACTCHDPATDWDGARPLVRSLTSCIVIEAPLRTSSSSPRSTP